MNTNADTIAQSIATAMSEKYAVHLIYGFEKDGVLLDIKEPSSVLQHMNKDKYQTLKEEKVIYGLTSNINTFNPVKIAFHEWISVFKDAFSTKTSFTNKLKYFIKPPGWKHDGSGLMSNDLRKKWLAENVKE